MIYYLYPNDFLSSFHFVFHSFALKPENKAMLEKPLRGIIPPVITPLLDDNTLDIIGLENLLSRMLQAGVSGVFILGTSGEAQNISYHIRKELIKHTCRIVGHQINVLVGITDTSFQESISLAAVAAGSGADAVVAAPPYYFSTGQDELKQYYSHLADRLALPLFLYNMPSHTKVMIEPATVQYLSEHPNIIGLKDSSANGTYFQTVIHLMRNKPDFSLFVGPEEMTAEAVLMGAHGGVNGGANLLPELYVELYQATVNKDFDKIFLLQNRVMEISRSLYSIGRFASSYIKGIKCALNLMGICSDYMAEPFHKFRQEEREVVRRKLIELNLMEEQ